ncbi:chalcone isomerase family protein [Desulfobulbus alkaliphilus]|uniref:chalcone isomerase family protein n=1 Tax=Desulfobulbus alkaliphilus TaxID=869814 RepID=UPI001962B213|nr:chalcone isomerase family protein [Desulfobulbus alkaliphilus]MBM9535612.1 chalcone isomerase family protein [Desulfobulbus alkaliphilus]
MTSRRTVCALPFFCLLLVFPLLITRAAAQTVTIENVVFADRVTIGGESVPLRNAALLRYLRFIKVYVAALYLPASAPGADVLTDVPKRLEIAYLMSFAKDDFAKGAAPVLERNLTAAELAAVQERIDRLNAAYRDVQAGDRYALTYAPGEGTVLTLNDEPLVTIEGADFAAAYFGVWLGREPLDNKLKRDLLRGP